MEYTVPLWYTFLTIALALSTFIAYPIVALFVTRPIQRILRQKNQDHISDWVVWPFKSGWYAMAIVVPFERWRHERNQGFMDTVLPIRQAANRMQCWLSLWLEVSMFGMVFLMLCGLFLEFMGVWSLGSG
ncbi:hypothetical protein [Alkalimonas amylolytica]|uniref:Uncharacterized protein n=1 Tax=Alkalimonas amylolytica TaxID=152573 RepID=A0A1H4CK55_ALKAM|nr:hypothetical protein [Alkalimonas amylolytica]SEA60718.1 hypothetical protein SAMN04488051_104199 [Alkalimonas amylolytica]